MKKNWKRMLSLLLTVCMIAGLLVLPAAADEGDEGGGGDDTPATGTYTITVTPATNGSVVITGDTDGQAAEGVTITVTATADDGYTLDAITVTGEDNAEVDVTTEDNVGTFEMPASDVTVTVTFAADEGGDEVDKTALTNAITAAEALADVVGSDDGTDVEPTKEWVATEKREALDTALSEAKALGDDATQAQVTAAAEKLAAAVKDVTDNKTAGLKEEGGGETVDKTALTNAITAAEALADVVGSDDGTDVEPTKEWVATEKREALDTALSEAKALGDDATQAQVTAAAEKLVAAVKDVTDNKTAGLKDEGGDEVDKSALTAAITAAQKLVAETTYTTQADNLPGVKYWDNALKTAYETAIADAQAVVDDPDATDEDVADAVTDLADATTTFQAGKTDGTKVDKAALEQAITTAEAKDTTLPTSADGEDIPQGTLWVTEKMKNDLTDALESANTISAKEDATQDEVNTATEALTTAIAAYQPADGKKLAADVSGLETAVAAAKTKMNGVETSEDGTDIDKDKTWVTSEVKNALEDAITDAEAVIAKGDEATETEITAAAQALSDAVAAFVPAAGTKEEPKPPVTEEYAVTVNPGAGGDAKASVTKAAEGTEVTLTITPNSGYVVDAITSNEVTVKDNKFIMPASDVTVTVTFKAESGEDPLPSGEPFDVVPGNLGQIDENSSLPANGLAEGYTATAVKTDDGAVTVALKANTLFKHKNAQDVEGFWIGFGMPIEGETGTDAYTYCLVEDGVDGSPIASIPGRVQTVDGKNYNTVYFNLDAADAGETVTVVIKQTKLADGAAVTYTVNITVDELTDPLTKALAEANQLRSDVQTSTDGANVLTDSKWVTRDVMDMLDDAYREAKTADASSDVAVRVAAAAKLNAVIATFKAAMKDGTRSSGGGRPAIGSGTAAGGGGAVSNNDVVNKTSETLDDGTKRDTETTKDGTVTVTETKPNGTKTVTTTTPAGEITTDVTLGNGVKSATVAIPVKDAGNGTVAVLVKDDGTEEVIRNSMAEDGNVVFALTKDAKVKIVNNAKKFVDIANHWAKDYVDYVTAREFFNGVDATHFSPDTAMTRAMLATVLFRLVGETNVDGSANYKDVAANTWYTDAVNWASKVGVVNGYPDGTFAPNRAITREELVVMFYRYAGSPEVDDATSLVAYQDADQVSSWAETAMRWAVKNGIINGKSVDTLLPRGNATRAEVSAVLQRYVNLAK